jgi:hypothetical protein
MAEPERPRQSGPASARTLLLVLSGGGAAAGAAGFFTGLLSSTVPFQILGWGVAAGCALVVIVRTARAVIARFPWGGAR